MVCERVDYYTGQRKKEGETDQICLAFSFCIPEVLYGYRGPTVRVVACILTHLSSNKISWQVVSIQPHTTISELPEHFCEAVVIERLPSGVFADPFELQHLVQRGVFVDAAVFGDTNLELPSALSNRSVVEVHMDIGHNILSKHTDELEINLELPLHARYPPLDGSGYSNVEMGIPDLFIRCSTERNAVCERCFWVKRAEHIKSLADAVLWRIPSGNKAHSQVVSYVTFTAAFLSTVLIVLAAVCYSPNSSSKNLKKLQKS
ncbi:hypothetical protein MKW98_031519 [Papaver atlanticum]|uniref:Phosphatidylinositol-glycan biosynthesis class X protein n=1 Tax=Papaver atlanticum TaxID=357466 RepID=A0AAD4S7C2_9MAGN|nr:hypothetical protein MKW98_031519 [Papaver atlanticum]